MSNIEQRVKKIVAEQLGVNYLFFKDTSKNPNFVAIRRCSINFTAYI